MDVSAATAELRAFNLAYTPRVGVLAETHLGSGLALAPARVLHEVGGSVSGRTAKQLRERLGLDSGHLTRLLGTLEDAGLVRVGEDPADRRRRLVTLTPLGAERWSALQQQSDAAAERIVAPLTPRQRDRLADALRTASLLVRAATVQPVEVPADDPRVRAAVAAYLGELGTRFAGGFDPTTGGADTAEPSTFWLLLSDGEVAGCGAVRPVALPDGSLAAEVKKMWVSPSWRGAGLGARLLAHLESVAATSGFDTVVLDTNGALTEAITLYDRSGYTRIERYNTNPYAELWFTKAVG